MSTYTLELGDYVYRLKCACCDKQKKRVWGFVSLNGDAHAIYYALLNIEEEHPRVGLSVSVGPWWDGADPAQRCWVHLGVWSEDDGIHMSIRDPQESNFFPWEKGGKALNREDAKADSRIEEIWRVADFIVQSDRAVVSYFDGDGVDPTGREERDGDTAVRNC